MTRRPNHTVPTVLAGAAYTITAGVTGHPLAIPAAAVLATVTVLARHHHRRRRGRIGAPTVLAAASVIRTGVGATVLNLAAAVALTVAVVLIAGRIVTTAPVAVAVGIAVEAAGLTVARFGGRRDRET